MATLPSAPPAAIYSAFCQSSPVPSLRTPARSDSEICLCEPSRKHSLRRCTGKLATNLLLVINFSLLPLNTQITQALINVFAYIFQSCLVRWCMLFRGEIRMFFTERFGQSHWQANWDLIHQAHDSKCNFCWVKSQLWQLFRRVQRQWCFAFVWH